MTCIKIVFGQVAGKPFGWYRRAAAMVRRLKFADPFLKLLVVEVHVDFREDAMTNKAIATFFVALLYSAPYGQAQEAMPLPPPHTENGITYVCGGVGSDEAARMKRAASKYDLMLTFATQRGDYLSDVKVDIADARGHALLTTVCDGPIMLVDMPKQGRYVVRGEMAGHAVSGTALLGPGARGKPLHLVLPGTGDTSG